MKNIFKVLLAMMLLLSLVACDDKSKQTEPEKETDKTTETDKDKTKDSEKDGEKEEPKSNAKKLEADVVVVGGGGAGIAAALSAAEKGAKVILIEKVGYLGGATMLSGGIIPAVGTKQQQDAGIKDDNEWFARDILRPSNYAVRKDLVYTVVENSKDLIEWLEAQGCEFTLIDNALFYGQSNYRMHLSKGGGAEMTATLIEKLNKTDNIEVMLNTPGTGLISENGEVVGVKANNGTEDLEIYAKNVVLATSGFGANKEMIDKYIPEVKDAYPYVAPGATGEGIEWGLELGAKVANMKAYQGHAFYNEETKQSLAQSMADNGGIFVNKNGVRFTNEYNGYSELTPHVLAQPENFAYLVINQEIADKTAKFKEYQEQGIVVEGKDVAELAQKLSIDEAALKDTFERYVASIEKGEDEFNKTKLPQSWTGPFYAMKITGDLRHTQGGLVTDIDGHVLKEDGSVIQGLYAAGGVTEGFASAGGAAYMSGDGLLQAFVFGRIAGDKAATETRGSVKATEWKDPNADTSKPEETGSKDEATQLKLEDGSFEGVGKGHHGDVKVKVEVKDKKIVSVEVLEQNETESIYKGVEEKVIPQVIEKNSVDEIDTQAGATESSQAILDAIKDALK